MMKPIGKTPLNTSVASSQGGGAMGRGFSPPPIFGISISKATKLAPNFWQKVHMFSPPKTKFGVTPLEHMSFMNQVLLIFHEQTQHELLAMICK